MFRKDPLRPNLITGDEGFSVEVLGRHGIEYREGDKALFVDSEVLTAGHGIAVFRESIEHWNPPNEQDAIDDRERDRILENIGRALASQNEPCQVL